MAGERWGEEEINTKLELLGAWETWAGGLCLPLLVSHRADSALGVSAAVPALSSSRCRTRPPWT